MASGSPETVAIADALAFVRRYPHLYLLARRPDGYPTGYAMMSKVRNGSVDFSTYGSSAKVRNLVREGQGAILAVANAEGDDRVLWARGRVSVLDGSVWLEADDTTATGPATAPRVVPVPKEIVDQVADRLASGKRIVLRLSLDEARFTTRLR